MLAISKNPQLFLDDYLIDRLQNIRRSLQKPSKHPANPLIKQDFPWEAKMISTYGTVLHDSKTGRFRCWYLASRGKPDVPDTPEGSTLSKYYTCYAESPDGIQWTKPMVGRGSFSGFEPHNVVIPKTHSICVIDTPDDPNPQRRFKAAGGGVYGTSPDGIEWDMNGWRDAVGKNDTGTSVVRWNDQWLGLVRKQEWDNRPEGNLQRAVGITKSNDFQQWTEKELIWTTDEQDGYPWSQPYGLCVSTYGDILIGLLPLLRLEPAQGNNSLGDMETQLMVSRDARNWHRVCDRAVIFDPSHGGPIKDRAWDSNCYPSSTFLCIEDEILIYYSGNNGRHGESKTPLGKVHEAELRCGIGLATLQADRFEAMQCDNQAEQAVLQTKSFSFSGKELLVNANLDNDTDLVVEVVDENASILNGLDKTACRLQRHNALRYRVEWQCNGACKSLAQAVGDHRVSLRFSWMQGDLFAFQVCDI